MTLDELAVQVAKDLRTLAYPTLPWVRPVTHPAGHVHDVVVVGGGQCGVATSFALKRAHIDNVVVLDSAPKGQAGVWLNFARMHTLRTPKHVTGPELGIPSLSVRAWFEATHGVQAWDDLKKIPRQDWHAYLNWMEDMLSLPMQHGWRVVAVKPEASGLLTVEARGAGGETRSLLARHVVLGTGIEGHGVWDVPRTIREALPAGRFAHTADAIDFDKLKGKRVAVLGAGASAFDNAATALEAGAGRVDLLARRSVLPSVNPNRWMEYHGFLHHFIDLSDAQKWRFMRSILMLNQPPPQETYSRCAVYPNFHLHLGSPLTGLAMRDDAIRLDTPKGSIETDFLIVGTGLVVDLSLRPELAEIAKVASVWRDHYTPPDDQQDRALGSYPYLDGSFRYTEKVPGSAPWLARVRSASFGAMPSTGSSAGISTLRPTVERIAAGIARDLFREQADADYQGMMAYAEKELVDLTLASESKP